MVKSVFTFGGSSKCERKVRLDHLFDVQVKVYLHSIRHEKEETKKNETRECMNLVASTYSI